MTVLNTAAEQMQIEADRAADPAAKARLGKTIDTWKKTVARYDDDAKSNEGRKQLAERAKQAEESRELALARYHNYEFASAAFQIGIVLASAEVITEMALLGWLSGADRRDRPRLHRHRPVGAARAAFFDALAGERRALTYESRAWPPPSPLP